MVMRRSFVVCLKTLYEEPELKRKRAIAMVLDKVEELRGDDEDGYQVQTSHVGTDHR